MLTQSRPIRKCVKPEFLRCKAFKKKKPAHEDPQKALRCKYQCIPFENKIVQPQKIECLHGDLPVMKVGQTLVTDISFVNEFKSIRELQTIEMFEQKALVVRLEDKISRDFSSWAKYVDELKVSEGEDLKDWAKVIQTFCMKYQRILCQPRKKAKSDGRRNYFSQTTESTQIRERELFDNYSCIQMRYRLKNNRNQLNEVVFSEKLLQNMGYSTDDFSFVVLREGFPQVFGFEEFPNHYGIKELMNRYFTLGIQNYETPEFDSLLCLKHGYVRKIKVRGFYSMNYENNLFGMDATLAITSIEEPTFLYSHIPTINEKFVQNMILKEKEGNFFFSSYYDYADTSQYTNMHKICKVKELS